MRRDITALMLYNYIKCPHRVTLDLYGNPENKDEVSPFVQFLWEMGNAFEHEVIDNLKIPFADLSKYYGDEKEKATIEAIKLGDNLIYSGRIRCDNLLGEPDILRKQNEGYVAGDIKSGAGLEGESDLKEGKPKDHYAVQLALYTDTLERLGLSSGRTPFVWDINGDEIIYYLDLPKREKSPKTLWDIYQDTLKIVTEITSKRRETLPAYAAICKLCQWRSFCTSELRKKKDLTLIPELGRSKRDVLLPYFKDIDQFSHRDVINLKVPHISPQRLIIFQNRANLLLKANSKPYALEDIKVPKSHTELFFDVETDPMRDVCYLHGFVERRNQDNNSERYIYFFADEPTPKEEENVFKEAWNYIKNSQPCVVFIYSKYERTIWRKLQQKYSHIVSKEEIENLFSPESTVDLYYDVVIPKTEWPTNDYSIKTLAKYLGFSWRDPNPSGTASIEWYYKWVENKDEKVRKRILDYNEDDCRAMRVLLDGIKKFNINP